MTRSVIVFCSAFSAALLLIISSFNSQAATPHTGLSDAEVKELLMTVRELKSEVQRLNSRIEQLEAEGTGTATPEVQQASPKTTTTTAAVAGQLESSTADTARAVEQRTNYQIEEALRQQNALLLPPKAVELELGVNYAYTSSEFVNIDGFSIPPVLVVGDIVSEQVDRWSVSPYATVRAGLPWQFQFDMRMPYIYETEERVRADGTALDRGDTALGDVELGLSRAWYLPGAWPDLVTRLNWKTTTGDDPFDVTNPDILPLATGTGFNGVQGTVTWIKPTDPALLYGSFGYVWNMEDTKNGATINPGDTVLASIGTAWAMSSDLTMNFGLSHRYTLEAEVDGFEVDGSSNTASSFNTGISYLISPKHALDVNLDIGLTEDAPDFLLSVSSPFRLY
jgi:outer membrane murein-binding lipoprotein Lpp